MCYNAETSLITFTFVSAICFYLWVRNNKIDRTISLILFILSIMQFLEYILWIHQECDSVNKFVSRIVRLYLYLQPAMLAFVTWLLGAGTGNYYPLIFITSLCIIPFSNFINTKCIHPGEAGHLDWNHSEGENLLSFNYTFSQIFLSICYYISMIYVISTLKSRYLSKIMLTLWTITWFITSLKYKKVWGSVWCHSINIAAIFAIFFQ